MIPILGASCAFVTDTPKIKTNANNPRRLNIFVFRAFSASIHTFLVASLLATNSFKIFSASSNTAFIFAVRWYCNMFYFFFLLSICFVYTQSYFLDVLVNQIHAQIEILSLDLPSSSLDSSTSTSGSIPSA